MDHAYRQRPRADHRRASDHGVSEAFYLDDPEGNGIEVYNDRLAESWHWEDKLVVMRTNQLDIEAILDERSIRRSPAIRRRPRGLRIGHIHLRVGSIEQAEAFYRGAIGLDLTRAPRRRDLHVVGRLSPSRRLERLAQATAPGRATRIAQACHGSRSRPRPAAHETLGGAAESRERAG